MRSNRWAYTFPCVVALGITLTSAACEGTLVPQGDGDPESGMMEAMQRDLVLSYDDARARIRVEAGAALLEPALRYQLGADAFGGAWMNADGTQLIVGITDAQAADVVREAGAEPLVVARSYSELAAVKESLDADVEQADASIYTWYVDPPTNTVVVSASDPSAPAVASFIGDRAPAVRVVASTERPSPLYDVRGGDEFILGGTILCSVGFAVHGGFVSAGHCGSPGTKTYGWNWIDQGTVSGSVFPVHDYSWITTNGAWNTLPWVGDHAGGAVGVAGSTVASVGSSVCRSGRTTGWRCGVIQARDVTINYSAGPVYGATQTSACAEPGDSGGSFISGNQAQGVTSGGTGDCTHGGTTFFQPVNPILQAYNLGLKTTGGGNEIVSYYNGKCIDVPFSNFSDGVKLWMWGCNGTSAQKWQFTNGTVRAGGLCMDVAWANTNDGTDIQIANCSGNPAQQFVLSEAGDLVSVLANKCVDIRDWSSDSGARLQIWSCSGNSNQKWYLR